MARRKSKKPSQKSLYGPIGAAKARNKNKSSHNNKPPVHKASSHSYKKRPSSRKNKKKQHFVKLDKHHRSKETRIPVQQIKFKLRLPPNGKVRKLQYKDMPWYNQEEDANPQYGGDTPSVQILEHVSNANLTRLDQELRAFSEYVRLTPHEYEAREYVISHVADVCNSTFRRRNDIRIHAFGSYATPQVCTFQSDVDLAVWGVVVGGTHTVFAGGNKTRSDSPSGSLSDTKQDRVQKWKEALAELDALERSDDEIVQQPQESKNGAAAAAVEATDSAGGTTTSDGTTADATNDETMKQEPPASNETEVVQQESKETTGDFLFVIDRVGAVEGIDADGSAEKQQSGEAARESRTLVESQQSKEQDMNAVASSRVADEEQRSSQQEQHGDGSADAPLVVDDLDGSAEAPLVIDDSASEKENASEEDSDADSADKLESYCENRAAAAIANNDDSDSEQENDGPIGSLSDSENDDLEVSFVSRADRKPAALSSAAGPTGETKKLVVGALQSLGRALWKSPVIHTVEVRRHARVPIIATGTHLGFEGDIAIGGHNGADTSQYASSQVQRFASFGPVVLFLKVLLGQQALDKPFTGGLGSYKLYVLVAHHLEKHVAMGGADRPSEVLATFLFRFRKFTHRNQQSPDHTSILSQGKTIRCDGGCAELKPVFKLEHCCDLFNRCWQRLLTDLEADDSSTTTILGKLVNKTALQSERDLNLKKASKLGQYSQSQKGASAAAKWNANRSARVAAPVAKKRAAEQTDANIAGDAGEAQLMAGYGMKRGPHGGLIPLNRPDVDARQSMPDEAIGRATKNRKNKKKQKRDEGLKEIALDHM